MISLPQCNRGGIQGIFLLFRKVFNIDQYDFRLIYSFAWIPQLKFLNVLEEIEIY